MVRMAVNFQRGGRTRGLADGWPNGVNGPSKIQRDPDARSLEYRAPPTLASECPDSSQTRVQHAYQLGPSDPKCFSVFISSRYSIKTPRLLPFLFPYSMETDGRIAAARVVSDRADNNVAGSVDSA